MNKSIKKITMEKLFKLIGGKQAMICKKILKTYSEVIYSIPGDINKHQSWIGGYLDHVIESMNISVILYKAMNSKRKLPFSLKEALFALFIHDFDKVLRYQVVGDKFQEKKEYNKDVIKEIKKIILQKYNYQLSAKELNALTYVHGEGNDYHPKKRIMLPLTTFIHCCDIISARLWFDEGKDKVYW